ncbi:amylo-alpha-1,6-glucosidase [Micromonospora cathayae]|uniref:Trehalase family glycosidase n=1 Tax=Micromonospora cathayae TaxID=3028804 RepID=A0ABY7ZXH0_9ACTN|nr:trehalase family glycosidase [Micromonospora sp. HUAS 3]WDZ87756.1 trehalase family glycosidase [Micromonospora sp. HUAS 3]
MTTDFHPTVYDLEGYLRTSPDPRALPGTDHPAAVTPTIDSYYQGLVDALGRTSPALPHPYLVPGAEYHSLWTWDTYFLGMALPASLTAHEVGSLRNLLERLADDGRPPSRIDPDGSADFRHVGQPIHAAWTVSLCTRLARPDLAAELWPDLLRLRDWWDRHTLGRRGLYRWVRDSGTGIDNDPALYGRGGDTVALVDVNCFHYRELVAMGLLAELVDAPGADTWHERADALRASINTFMWDEAQGTYFHLDLTPHRWKTFQEITWEVPLLTQTWANLFPLWTGVADQRRADRLVTGHVLDERRFRSRYGLRSTPADQRFYNNQVMANPSNWQGPVWGLNTALTAYGLARYGYRTEATALADDLRATFTRDLARTGAIHEYYDAETGRPLAHPHFVSWNLLATRLSSDLATGHDPTRLSRPSGDTGSGHAPPAGGSPRA